MSANNTTVKPDTEGLDATTVSARIGHKKQENDNTETVTEENTLKNIKQLVQHCKTAINEARKNAEDAFKYQSQVNLFIERNSVKDKEGNVDFEKTKKNIGYEETAENTVFVGNAGHGTNILEKYIGKWVVESEKKWDIDGDYSYTGKFHPNPAEHVKDVGVENLGKTQHFYGKFEESKRKSGIYTWTTSELKFLGQFDGHVSGYGCWEKVDNENKQYVVGKFTSTDNKITMPSQYLIFTTDKNNHNVRWYDNPVQTYKIFNDSDRNAILSAFGLDKVTENFKSLGMIEYAIQTAEGFTGYGRTALGVGAAVAVAGLGYLAYKKWWSKKSSPAKKTQKKKSVAKRLGRYINPYSWSFDDSSSSSSSSSSKKKKATPAAASSESNAASASASAAAASASASAAPAPASAPVAKKIEEKDSKESSSAAAAAKPKPKRVYQTRSKVASPASASPQTTVEDSKAPAKPTVNKRSQKKVTPTPTPTRRSARLNGR